MDRLTDVSKIITLPKTSFAGGKNDVAFRLVHKESNLMFDIEKRQRSKKKSLSRLISFRINEP